VDLRGGTVLCSATHLRLLGYVADAPVEYALEMWKSWVHADDRARVQEERDCAIRERGLYATEYRVRRADDGVTVWLAVFGRCYYDERGAPARFVGVTFDVTRRKELEREIRRKELEREILAIADREQRHIGQALHDGAGQELTGLGLMAQTLSQLLPAPGAEQRIAVRLVAGLTHLHEELRSLARGLLPVEVESKGLWAALSDLAARASERSGVAVLFESPRWVALPDHATSTELYRIAQEALSNALRHGRPRTVRVALLLRPDGLRLCVADDGVGIPEAAERTTGLGVRIMEHRAESLGGTFEIAPAQEGGTVVTVTLPWRTADGAEQPGLDEPDQNPGSG
jgi:PAS domain S-box-containing protein